MRLVALAAILPSIGFADEFTFTNDAGDEVTVEGRLAGQGQGVFAVELADGGVLLLPERAVTKRVEKEPPEALTHEQVEKNLQETFVDGRVLTIVEEPYVLALVTARKEFDERTLRKKQAGLTKLARLFVSLETKFRSFVRTTRVPVKPVAFPLVVLVFESDANFETYARMVTGDKDLPARNIAGFYDLRSNHLVLRVSEMDDYRTLIHEGVHQQVFNRRIIEKFSPVPVWFNEGIATGFEGDGETLRSDPKIPNEVYGPRALLARQVDFEDIVRGDGMFKSAAFAGPSYARAWALHWLLCTKYRAQYAKYVRLMSAKKSLALDDADTRQKEFEETIGKSVEELEREYANVLRLALRRRKR